MKLSENIEEYLEVLYRYGSKDKGVSTTKISKVLGLAPGSVTGMLKKLSSNGYINYEPYKGAILTDKGLKIGKKITRKHRILEKFLSNVLNITDKNIHDEACKMEHSLSDEAERAMCLILKHPDFCPDGKLIPYCDYDFDNCEECQTNEEISEIGIRDHNLVPISQLLDDEKGEVAFIRGGSSTILPKLISLGIAIGTKIQLENKIDEQEPIKIKVNENNIEITQDISNNVFIKLESI
ncbi:MAG: metal-dependent transcriptional regulator [Methanobrevibacter sp.]|jgi:DtxR family Mn-dependent transcriptional regulator|nr:metal-dependent transcriptional regulator [Candidatus Methanovirga basalitermitum]